jgi:hypothetical protein
MNRTVLAVIVIAVIIAIAGFLFYDGSTGSDTIDPVAPTSTPAPAPAP